MLPILFQVNAFVDMKKDIMVLVRLNMCRVNIRHVPVSHTRKIITSIEIMCVRVDMPNKITGNQFKKKEAFKTGYWTLSRTWF